MDAIGKIERLQKLLSDGAITQEEFNTQKQTIINDTNSNERDVPEGLEEKEQTYFKRGNIHITSTRAIFPQKTYAMANITSVSIGEKQPNRTPPIILIVIGVFLLAGSWILGGILIITSIIWLNRLNNEYSVRIGSASGEVDGLTSKNQQLIQKVVSAMNDAIINRG